MKISTAEHMIRMAPLWGKACAGNYEDFVPPGRHDIKTKTLIYVKLNPNAWVYWIQTSYFSHCFWLPLIKNINHTVACLCCLDCSIMLLKRNLGLKR